VKVCCRGTIIDPGTSSLTRHCFTQPLSCAAFIYKKRPQWCGFFIE